MLILDNWIAGFLRECHSFYFKCYEIASIFQIPLFQLMNM
jgi:hypothetical protein